MKQVCYAITFLILFSSCDALTGEEVGRLKINKVSNEDELFIEEATVQLDKGDKLSFWSDMDLEFQDDLQLRFRFDILKDGEEYGGLEIDPFEKNITLGEVKTSINGDTKWSFTGKNQSIEIEESCVYTFKAILVASENPTLIIKKAEVVLKK